MDTARRSVEEGFKKEIDSLLQHRNTIGLTVGAFFFPLYVFQDQTVVPEKWQTFLALRLTGSLLCILLMALSKSSIGHRRPLLITLVACVGLSVLKVLITPLELTGLSALYFAGHALIIVIGLSYLPLSLSRAFLLGLCCQLGYAVPTLLSAPVFDPDVFLIQNSYLSSIVILLSFACHLNFKMRRQEFELRSRLYQGRSHLRAYGREMG